MAGIIGIEPIVLFVAVNTLYLVLLLRIERRTEGYEASIIPLNYRSNGDRAKNRT